jgi:hypothetical protein
MLGIGYFKAQPNEWIRHYTSGKTKKQGEGLTFYYLRQNTQIVAVPLSSRDVPFVFNELTNNFQSVTLQGQFTYAITDPAKVTSLLNFTLNLPTRQYLTNDPEKLPQRLTNIVQTQTRIEIQKRTLEQSLVETEAIGVAVMETLRADTRLMEMGVELLSLFISGAKPTPEVARALEATYRESLLRNADEAVYARRAAAVEEERKIKENELATDVALAQQQAQLIALAGENELQQAQNHGRAVEIEAESAARALELQMAVWNRAPSLH